MAYRITKRNPPSGYHVARFARARKTICGAEIEANDLYSAIRSADAQAAVSCWLGWCERCFNWLKDQGKKQEF